MATGRPCTICGHAERDAIDRALVAAGAAVSAVSVRFGVSAKALARHRLAHLPQAARQEGAQAEEAAEAKRAGTLLDQAAELRDTAMALLQTARQDGDIRTALQGVREAARCLELMAKLTGDIDASATVNVLVAPAFISVQVAILAALAPYPDARAAVVRALGTVR